MRYGKQALAWLLMVFFVLSLSACVHAFGERQMSPESDTQAGLSTDAKRQDAPSQERPSGIGSSPAPAAPQASAAVAFLVQKSKREQSMGNFDQAGSYLDRAYRLAPSDPAVSYAMSELLLDRGEPGKAEHWAMQGLSLLSEQEADQRASFWQIISDCRAKMGDVAGANEAQSHAQRYR